MRRIFFLISLFWVTTFGFGQFWESIGPEGGFFKDFVIHPSNPAIVYAGSDDGGGVWKSENSGASWRLLTGEYPNFTGWHIEMDLDHPDTLYFCEIYGRYGILKSTDGGETISHLTEGFIHERDLQTTQLAIFPGEGDTLFISTGEGGEYGRVGNGVFASFDGGSSWSYRGLQNTSVHCIHILPSGRVLAGTDESGLWFSDDVGETWTLHPSIPDTASIFQVDEEDGIIVVSAAANGVYLSEDGGSSFENIGVVGDFNFDLAITATEPYLEIISSGFFQPNRYSSETDTWVPLDASFMEGHLLIGIDAVGDEIYAGIFSNTKIIHSSNGGDTWERLDHNPIASEIRAVVVAPDSDRIYTSIQNSYNFSGDAYNTESISRTTDGGDTWDYIGPLAHGLDLVMHPENAETLFLGTFANGLFRTTDGFDSWENVRAGNKLIPSIAINKISPGEILISEFDFSESTFGIYKSEDGGDSFYKTGDIVATDMVYRDGTDTVYFSHDTGIYMSIDNAESVPAIPAFLTGENVLSLAYGASYLYAGTEEGRLYKIDAAGLVEEITGGWNVDKPTAVNNILHFGSSLIVGLNGAEQDTLNNLSGGVWQSLDGGGSWIDLSAGLTNNNVFGNTGFAISNEGSLIVATYGQGCFQSTGLILGIAETEKGNELELSLYPNPSADILFFITQFTPISGQILDASGQIVHQLSDQNLDEGKVSIRDLSPGAYWLQFLIGNEWKTVPFHKK